MEQSRYRDAMRYLISVGMFQYPNILVAKTFLGKVYFYHFDEPSPYIWVAVSWAVCAFYVSEWEG